MWQERDEESERAWQRGHLDVVAPIALCECNSLEGLGVNAFDVEDLTTQNYANVSR